jgi:hypothetical protein
MCGASRGHLDERLSLPAYIQQKAADSQELPPGNVRFNDSRYVTRHERWTCSDGMGASPR